MNASATERGTLFRGVLYGLIAALAWAVYNVGAKVGTAQGFRAPDLTLLRFAVAGIVMLPVFIRRGFAGIGAWRGFLLAMSAGPLFALVVNAGFTWAPLSHGVVFGPGSTLLSTMILARILDGEHPSRAQILGSGILGLGLVVIAIDGIGAGGGRDVVLGDLAFIAAGCFWGIFTTLLKRWRIDPLHATAVVGVLSAIVFAPMYFFLFGGRMAFPTESVAAQAFFQGVLGGCVGVLSYAATVRLLGAGRAALFPAFVPAIAVLLSIPVLDKFPTASELVGLVLCTIGLLVAIGLFARRRATADPGFD